MKPLRLLIVEDPNGDAQSLLAELRRNGYVLFYEQVDNAVAMRAALEREEWDTVVSEYNLANFSGMDALFLAQAHDPDLPFILFADSISDELIVVAMKAGARDFIPKARLNRLAPALKREIDQAALRYERRRAEAALRESEARHRSIVEDQTELICCFLADHTLIFVNDAYCRYLGQSRNTLLGRNFTQFVPSDEQEAVQSKIKLLNPDKPVAVHENPVFVADGRLRWVQWTHRAVFDDQRRLVEYQSVGRDITERKQMEIELRRARDELERRVVARTAELEQANAALRESEARYRLLAENVGDVIWTADARQRFTYVSPSILRMMGYTPDEIMPMSWHDLMSPDSISVVEQFLTNLPSLSWQTMPPLEVEQIRKDGDTIWVEIKINPLLDSAGRVIGVIGITRDITRRRAAQEALRLSAEQLEIVNENLKSFSYTVSHDLKLPVTQMFGFAEVLMNDYGDKLDAVGKLSLQNIFNSAKHMGELIDSLLEFSLVGQQKLIRDSVNLSELAAAIAASLKTHQPERLVEFAIAPDITTKGDSRLLRIVLRNLLENAWKYTGKQPQPRIEFGMTNAAHPVYFVRDNGAGFDDRQAENIFTPFQRLHNDFDGTGIGLATVHRIIQRHGGHIWAEGAIGEGATFYFTL